jgi:MraZ protein
MRVAQGAAESAAVPFFRGAAHLALDAKGRLAIPTRHREALVARGGRSADAHPLVLTVDPSRCLLLYPRQAWEPIETRLMLLSSFNENIRRLQRLLVGHAEDVEMDGAGRILVSPMLRRFAGLDHRVVLVGQGNKLELWDEARWEEQTTQAITFSAGELPGELDGFSL